MRLGPMFPALLRSTFFRRYWLGQAVSQFGDQITSLALPLTAVIALHASAEMMSFLTAVVWIPALLGLQIGSWVDRIHYRRKVMIASDIARSLFLISIPVIYALGYLSMSILLVDAFFIGVFRVVFNVCSNTLFVTIVPKENYVAASSLLNGSRAVSSLAGPTLAGFLIQLMSAPFALVADAFSFLASALSLARIHPPEPALIQSQARRTSAGLRFIWSSSTFRYSLAAVATINLFNYIFQALFVLYATSALHVSPGWLGLIIGIGAVGAIIGSTLANQLAQRFGLGYTFLMGAILFPAPLILIPVATGHHVFIVTFLILSEFFSGFGVMLLDISWGAIRAVAVPDSLRSRVSGAWGLVNNGIRPLGALIGGGLSSWIGIHGALWVGTIGACLGFLWLFPSRLLPLRDVQDFVPQEADFDTVV